MKKSALRTTAYAALIAGVASATALAPLPASAEMNFKGKTVTMIIGTRPGGGTDAVGRLLGEQLVKQLPGKPGIIFRNMPAGGGTTAMNYMAREVKPDGMTIIMASSTQADPSRFRRKASKFNPMDFGIIGGVQRGATVLMITKEGSKRLLDPKAKPVVIGAVDGTRSGIVMAMWGAKFLNWNIKWVVGYPGTPELILALQRGEIDMSSTGNSFLIKELIKGGKHEILTQSGTLQNGKLEPREEFKENWMFPTRIRPKIQNALQKEAFDYWEGINGLDKWMALPPRASKEVLSTYRAAFNRASKTPEFIDRGRKVISPDMIAIGAKDQTAIIRQIAKTSAKALAWIDTVKKAQGLPVDRVKKKVKHTTISTVLDDVKRGGRLLGFKIKGGKAHRARVSTSKTDVQINGKMGSRAKLKPGMSCTISYPGDNKTAAKVFCKK
jgi:tripartite-type tricarboxylate transporter receptor subunit TctC